MKPDRDANHETPGSHQNLEEKHGANSPSETPEKTKVTQIIIVC